MTPDYSDSLARMVLIYGLPVATREHRFHPKRKWRLDLSWPLSKLAVEVEGGVWTRGRHTRPRGFLNDIEKYNALTLLGWSLLRVTPKQVKTGEALDLIAEWFKNRYGD